MINIAYKTQNNIFRANIASVPTHEPCNSCRRVRAGGAPHKQATYA
jgi:hypothetical protein